MSYYDPKQDDDWTNVLLKIMFVFVLFILLIGSCRSNADEPVNYQPLPSLVEQQIISARAVIIYQLIKVGVKANSANDSVLSKCGWLKPEHILDIINRSMPKPKNWFEFSSDIGIIVEEACGNPLT